MEHLDVDTLVIGWGKGGKTLAGALGRQGRTVAMVERSTGMYGGSCINIACVPTKDLVHSAAQRRPDDELQAWFTAAVAGRVLPLGDPSEGTYVVSPRAADQPTEYRAGAVPWAVGTGGNFAASRAWLDRVGRFDERLGAGSPGKAAEDADLIYRILRTGGIVRYEPLAVVYNERQTEQQRLRSRWTASSTAF